MEKLHSFSAYELQLLLCGEQTPNWTRDDIINFTEPKFGYSRERLVDVACVWGGVGGCGLLSLS